MQLNFKKWGRRIVIFAIILLIGVMLVPAQEISAQEGTTYTVQSGDNLFRISLRYGTTVQAIVAANGIVNPNIIHVGQVLIIPDGATAPPPTTSDPAPTTPTSSSTYTVQRGDTLGVIAQRYSSSVAAIASANNIVNVNLIFAGQVLVIPGGTGSPTPTTPTTPSTPTTPTNPAPSGSFALGGHVQGFGRVDIMRAAGMSWAKIQIRWNRGEGTGAAANAINEARANGLSILLGIVGYSNQMGDYDAYTNEFAAYLGQVAALGPDAIEVWNEPNLVREWPAGQVSGANYTTMLARAYSAIKTANPNVLVISAAPAPTGAFGGGCGNEGCDDILFLQQMRAAGATNAMDCLGAHYNEGIISPDLRSGDPRATDHYTRYFYGMLDTYYNAFGGQRQVCWTELGYLSGEGYQSLPPAFGWAANTSVAEHAQWLGRAAQLSRSSGRVRLMIVWNVDFTGVWGDDPQGGYAILRPDGSCPACGQLAAAVQ